MDGGVHQWKLLNNSNVETEDPCYSRNATTSPTRHNGRRLDTLEQVGVMVKGAECKQLRHKDLTE